MIDIFTDSTADLSNELIERFHIKVIPLLVTLQGQTYKDGVEIDQKLLFRLVDECKELPTTAAPSVLTFENAFSASEADEIIYVGISSELSATIQNAQLAIDSIKNKKIWIIDSKNISTGIALLVLEAAGVRDRGDTTESILDHMYQKIQTVHTSFTIDRLDYLYMGGRCSAMQNVVSSILKIRPVISVNPNGTLGVKEKIRGARKKALEAMLIDYEKNLSKIDFRRIFVTHTGCDDDAAFLVEEIKKLSNPEEIYTTNAGSVISSHCGPNTIGIIYLLK